MQIRALYDGDGKILAAVDLDAAAAAAHAYPQPRARAEEGHTVQDFELPQEYQHMSVAEACGRLRVHGDRLQPAGG